MKKIVLLVASIFSIGAAIAGGDQTGVFSGIQKKKEITKGGFYLHLGLANPTFKDADSEDDLRVSMGIQPSFEFGNNFMFYRNDKFGVGMNVSWLTFGYSTRTKTYTVDDYEFDLKASSLYLSFLKLGPMATIAINDDMAVDAFLDFSPTLYFGTLSNPDIEIEDASNGFIMSGVAIAPGVKFRYKKLCAGIETQFGNLNYASTEDDVDDEADFKASYFSPRLMLGFKF